MRSGCPLSRPSGSPAQLPCPHCPFPADVHRQGPLFWTCFTTWTVGLAGDPAAPRRRALGRQQRSAASVGLPGPVRQAGRHRDVSATHPVWGDSTVLLGGSGSGTGTVLPRGRPRGGTTRPPPTSLCDIACVDLGRFFFGKSCFSFVSLWKARPAPRLRGTEVALCPAGQHLLVSPPPQEMFTQREQVFIPRAGTTNCISH